MSAAFDAWLRDTFARTKGFTACTMETFDYQLFADQFELRMALSTRCQVMKEFNWIV